MSATVVERAERGWVIRTSCPRCARELVLPSEVQPNTLAQRVAAIVVCESCADASEREEEEVRIKEERRRRLHGSHLPTALRRLEWSEMVVAGSRAAVVQAAEKWARDEYADGLCLYGAVGTGKTRLAATAAWTRLERWPVRWVSVAGLVATLDAAWGDEERRDALRVLTGAGPLILDDLDKVVPSERGRHQLYTAIDARVQAGSPLLVTMNSSLRELGQKFGEPIASRIAGHCQGSIFQLEGADRRLTRQAA